MQNFTKICDVRKLSLPMVVTNSDCLIMGSAMTQCQQGRLSLSTDDANEPLPILEEYFSKNGNLILKIIYE